eukprot:6475652-Amphidinium_carterae.1
MPCPPPTGGKDAGGVSQFVCTKAHAGMTMTCISSALSRSCNEKCLAAKSHEQYFLLSFNPKSAVKQWWCGPLNEKANAVWAMAKLQFLDADFLSALSASAVATFHAAQPQDACSSYHKGSTKVKGKNKMFSPVQSRAEQRLVLNSHSPWVPDRLRRCGSHRFHLCHLQDISSTVWAFAKLAVPDAPLFHMISKDVCSCSLLSSVVAVSGVSECCQLGLSLSKKSVNDSSHSTQEYAQMFASFHVSQVCASFGYGLAPPCACSQHASAGPRRPMPLLHPFTE